MDNPVVLGGWAAACCVINTINFFLILTIVERWGC